MAEVIFNEQKGGWEFRQKLRSAYIDYFNGVFFITFQVKHNKSVLGAIVGERCVLNELGEAVKEAWEQEPLHVQGLQLREFVVMPNHFHAIVEYHSAGRGGPAATDKNRRSAGACGDRATVSCGDRAAVPCGDRAAVPCGDRATVPCGDRATVPGRYTRAPDARDLPYVVGLFKSYTTNLYFKLKAAGRCLDIGTKLWQESFYDELIRSDEQCRNTANYIRRNPANWNSDRFGAVTSYVEGNIGLLQTDYVAYMSSEGRAPVFGLPMVKYGDSREMPHSGLAATQDRLAAASDRPPVISTFTSYYERQMLARCLANGRRIIWVCPGGISPLALSQTAAAREADLALLISPVAPGTGVNKQRANWCNQFIAKNATEIWIGHLRPGGSLETILKAVRSNR